MSINVLVGADFYFTFMSGKCIKGALPNSPVALESCIGWVLTGPTDGDPDMYAQLSEVPNIHGMAVATCSTYREASREDFKEFWSVEAVPDRSDQSSMDDFFRDIEFDGYKYISKLPFRSNNEFLPDNYQLSRSRLISLRKQFDRDPDLRRNYQNIIDEYEREKIIERVSPTDVGEPGKVHYNPHRPVVRLEKETTKVRMVLDCSAKTKDGPSLNECLYPGPNLLAKIFDIVLRIRCNRILIVADIKQAFLQIGINEEHKDYLRFLMFDPNDSNKIIIYRFLRVLFGGTCSPFLLQGTLRHHCKLMAEQGRIDPSFVEDFLLNLYVDDSNGGVDSTHDGFQWYREAKCLMKSGGFTLRKWCTNDDKLQQMINKEEGIQDIGAELDSNNTDTPPQSLASKIKSVLGINWDVTRDEFVFNFRDLITMAENMQLTRRNILRISSSFYNVTGEISPIIIQGKRLFQSVCKEKLDWDTLIPQSIVELWIKFIDCLKMYPEIRFSRFILHVSEPVTSVQLHGFCDASKSAYCAAIYVRQVTSVGVHVSLLTAKTKVAPLTELTIPRLELLSCLLLMELLNAVKNAIKCIKFSQTYCWSDSEISLYWIMGVNKRWNQWVQNRVVKIRKLENGVEWRHVPGNINPADVATRNISAKDLLRDSIWFSGPKFLTLSEQFWPNTNIYNQQDGVLPELIESKNVSTLAAIKKHVICTDSVLPVDKFSNINRLLYVTSYVLRFKNNILSNLRGHEKCANTLNVQEIKNAENYLIKNDQILIADSEKFNLMRKSLNIFVDNDGLLRIKGRLELSDVGFESKFPLLLRDSHLAHLYILKSHMEVLHGGVENTLNHLRNRFWIVRGRQVVKRVLYRCVVCRRHQGKTLTPPTSPPLPAYRVSADFCFQSTGMDFAGPLLVKPIYTKDARLYKAYICLFTCATSRAIHLELVPDLTGSAFIRAVKRFIARRGYPGLMISDNGKNFTAEIVKTFLLRNNIVQKFILPASPWWGGFYERLVRSVKLALRKSIGKAKLTYEEMETSLIEIEAVINTRPITYLYDDEVVKPLTPSHLMVGRNLLLRTDAKSEMSVISAEELGKRTRYIQTSISLFWNRFKSCYLAELREHHMHQNRKNKVNDENSGLKVGDVVIVKDDNIMPRCSWRVAKVDDLVVGRDSKVRGGILSTISRDGMKTKISRPLQKLIPLEVTDNVFDENTNNTNISPARDISDDFTMNNLNSEPCAANCDVIDAHVENEKRNCDISENPEINTENGRPRRLAAATGELIRRIRKL